MINSAYYYPTLISSINYGGLRYLDEFKLMKKSLNYVGEVKLCNINISCKNLIGIHECTDELINLIVDNSSTSSSSSYINANNIKLNKILSQIYTNWNSDINLGAGILNRFGAAIISLVIFLFDTKKVTKVNGTCKTFVKHLNIDLTSDNDENNNITNDGNKKLLLINKTRQITADDFCNFQLNLEPSSILVNVTINSLAQCKYKQEILVSGTNGTLILDNKKLIYRSTNISPNSKNIHEESISNRNEEKEIYNNDNECLFNNLFNSSFSNIERVYPELPLIFIKGLYYYLENVKDKFNNNNENSGYEDDEDHRLDSFEHTKIVQLIINNIYLSSEQQKWININYGIKSSLF
jgi:hypothetical protein